ncbi:CinA family protein [Haloechinothrix sp. LS1_15]|uniref:CinA family protein n=1 Tax=Haloechinothrix sp. LS1_15 TaxID=2652248 RepID=UPI0029489D64|nr:CinA family protein [Haloechinothrix sp. LS1_15]MDV6012163.1 CinA family protein [Haloechinothrix sp. LS1_15]
MASGGQRDHAADTTTTQVITSLIERGQTVATAESMTAGAVCARLTSVAGASAAVRGGLIVYATELKARLAGVDGELLRRHGPVHPEVATELAGGAVTVCGADWGLAVTGVAGPGPQDGIPSGTVHLAVAGPGVRAVRTLRSAADRAGVRAASVAAAVELLREHLH